MNGWGKNSSAVLLVVGSRCKWWALVVLITAFQLVSSTPPSIGICAAVRREGLLLVEWLEYHSLIGVNNFYIYLAPRKLMSNQEADVTDGLLAPYLHPRPGCTDCPSVQIFRQERPRIGFHPQAAAFDTCLKDFAKENEGTRQRGLNPSGFLGLAGHQFPPTQPVIVWMCEELPLSGRLRLGESHRRASQSRTYRMRTGERC